MGGFSASGATVILLIGVVVSVGILFPVVESEVSTTGEAFSDQHKRVVETKNADFEVNITTYDAPNGGGANTGELQLEINNTGTEELQIDEIDFQLDGEYTAPDNLTVAETPNIEREMLAPGETLVAEFILEEEVNRVHITIETGQSKQVTT